MQVGAVAPEIAPLKRAVAAAVVLVHPLAPAVRAAVRASRDVWACSFGPVCSNYLSVACVQGWGPTDVYSRSYLGVVARCFSTPGLPSLLVARRNVLTSGLSKRLRAHATCARMWHEFVLRIPRVRFVFACMLITCDYPFCRHLFGRAFSSFSRVRVKATQRHAATRPSRAFSQAASSLQ